MTTIITRYFENADHAEHAKRELVYGQRVSPSIIRIYDSADGLAETLKQAHVAEDAAKEYEKRMGKGGAVVAVRAGYKPLGVAKITREVLSAKGAADLGDFQEETFYKDERKRSLKILHEHPYMLTRRRQQSGDTYHMADFPIPLISRRKPYNDMVISRHGRMADKPIGLLLPGSKRYGRFPFDFLIPGHKFMAKFPFGHIVPGHKFMAKFPFAHIVPGHKFMAKFPFGHIVPGHKFMAKFPFGHIVPGHNRMANWPFPLLINGKQHTNSLVPGHKFMAKFPIDHLVPGHKFMAKFPFAHIVPGHKFMAKFPFAHIVPGHKFMAKFPFAHIVPGHKHMAKFPFDHIVPGHKYMANWIFPHTKAKA